MRETFLLILAVLIGAANAEFSLEIQLKSLKVDGTLSTGAKCSAFSALGFDCSPRPKICIELIPYVTEDFADCYSGSFIDLGVFSNTNEITFDATGTYSGWQNPSVYSLNSDYQGFQVKLVVYNAEGVYYNKIDEQSFTFTSESADAEQKGGKIESFKLSYALRSAGTAVPTTTLNTISTTTNAGVTTTTVTGTGSTVTTTTVGGSTTTVTGGTSISTTITPLASTTTNLASSTTTNIVTTTTTPSGGNGF